MEYAYLHFPAESVHVDAREFGQLPDSARKVFDAVKEHGPVTHAGLRECTGMPARTIRFAVKRLKDVGFVDTRCSLKDCRTCYFFVDKRRVGVEALAAARAQAQAAREQGRLIEQA